MAEYIEREAACAVINRLKSPARSPAQNEMIRDALIGLERIPAADVAPVRHGTYISIGYDELYCDFGKCSVCGFEDVVKGSKYCPNCGAKMDGEK